MTHSSHGNLINTRLQILVKTKTAAAVVVFFMLLIPRLWAENLKEYIYLDGKAVAVETCNAVSLSKTLVNVNAAGENGSVTVYDVGAECHWMATSNVSWITMPGGDSGTGNGTVNYTIEANPGPGRTGTITIAGKTFTVNQANGCTYNISPTNANPAAGGGSDSVSVTCSDANCAPAATSNASSWITNVTVSGSGTTKTVNYTVTANTGPARTGTITIGGKTFTITQADGCIYNLSATSASPKTSELL